MLAFVWAVFIIACIGTVHTIYGVIRGYKQSGTDAIASIITITLFVWALILLIKGS